MGSERAETCRPLVLVSQPRSASNLLLQILALDEQPNVFRVNDAGGYLCMEPTFMTYDMGVRGKPVKEWTDDQRIQAEEAYQRSIDTFHGATEDAKVKGKILFLKEHAYFMTDPNALAAHISRGGDGDAKRPNWPTKLPPSYGSESTYGILNNTIYPDQFLKTWRPTFLIRHPALMFPSYHRAMTDLFSIKDRTPGEASKMDHEAALTLRWARTLYDWYIENNNVSDHSNGAETSWPLVLDADDVINDQAVVTRYAETIGLDTSKLRFSWTPAKENNESVHDKMMNRMLSTLHHSVGIRKDKIAGDIDIDAEAVKWKAEFGAEDGANMERLVKAAMPDYEYLKARRFKLDG